jgi:hypothetical protein
LMEKLTLVGFLALVDPGSWTQLFMGTIVALFSFVLQAHFAPYRTPSDNFVAFVASLALVSVFLGSLGLQVHSLPHLSISPHISLVPVFLGSLGLQVRPPQARSPLRLPYISLTSPLHLPVSLHISHLSPCACLSSSSSSASFGLQAEASLEALGEEVDSTGELVVLFVFTLAVLLTAFGFLVLELYTARELLVVEDTGQPPELALPAEKRWHVFLSHHCEGASLPPCTRSPRLSVCAPPMAACPSQ